MHTCMCKEPVTDSQLIDAHHHGCETALMELWMRYDSLVYGMAHSITSQKEAAEDIRQDVFLKVFKQLCHVITGAAQQFFQRHLE